MLSWRFSVGLSSGYQAGWDKDCRFKESDMGLVHENDKDVMIIWLVSDNVSLFGHCICTSMRFPQKGYY